MGAKEDLVNQLEQGGNNAVQKNPEDQELKLAEEAHRPELVCKEDIMKVVDMDKPTLQKYADSRLGKKLDLSKRLKMLHTEVVIHIKNKLSLPTDTVGKPDGLMEEAVKLRENPEFIFNPKNRRVFEWTVLLAKRTDLIECWPVDKEGKRL
jgi:hypothetical protein